MGRSSQHIDYVLAATKHYTSVVNQAEWQLKFREGVATLQIFKKYSDSCCEHEKGYHTYSRLSQERIDNNSYLKERE